MKLPNLVFKPFPLPGIIGVQAVYKDWSVILHTGSYGNSQGLYEVMGPGFDDGGGVEGYLELGDVMTRIASYELGRDLDEAVTGLARSRFNTLAGRVRQ